LRLVPSPDDEISRRLAILESPSRDIVAAESVPIGVLPPIAHSEQDSPSVMTPLSATSHSRAISAPELPLGNRPDYLADVRSWALQLHLAISLVVTIIILACIMPLCTAPLSIIVAISDLEWMTCQVSGLEAGRAAAGVEDKYIESAL